MFEVNEILFEIFIVFEDYVLFNNDSFIIFYDFIIEDSFVYFFLVFMIFIFIDIVFLGFLFFIFIFFEEFYYVSSLVMSILDIIVIFNYFIDLVDYFIIRKVLIDNKNVFFKDVFVVVFLVLFENNERKYFLFLI